MSGDAGGDGRGRLSPTRQHIIAALEAAGGGPLPPGELAFAVCAVMGVDTTGCTGAYALRHLPGWSWTGYVNQLRQMTGDGALTVRTRQQWHAATRGRLFPDLAYGGLPAYALAAPAPLPPAQAGPQWEAAVRAAERRVLEENRARVQQYAREFMEGKRRA